MCPPCLIHKAVCQPFSGSECPPVCLSSIHWVSQSVYQSNCLPTIYWVSVSARLSIKYSLSTVTVSARAVGSVSTFLTIYYSVGQCVHPSFCLQFSGPVYLPIIHWVVGVPARLSVYLSVGKCPVHLFNCLPFSGSVRTPFDCLPFRGSVCPPF